MAARASKKKLTLPLAGVPGVELVDAAPRDAAAVAALATELGATLPADYARFLATCGGGWVRPQCLFPDSKTHRSALQSLCGVRDKPPVLGLGWARRTFATRVPDDLLVIGSDVFGNKLCLGLRGKDRGKVFFWDHERETPDEVYERTRQPWRDNLTRVAPSFTAFLCSLEPLPDDAGDEG